MFPSFALPPPRFIHRECSVPRPLVAASHLSFLYSLGNWVMKTESYISALCFQRSKCDCQVYKRLFMFSGMKWERVCGAEREKDCPARADSTAFILHATADKALVPLDRDHKSSPERCCTYSLYHSGWQTHNNPHSAALLLSLSAPPSSWDLKWWQEKVGKHTKPSAQRKGPKWRAKLSPPTQTTPFWGGKPLGNGWDLRGSCMRGRLGIAV